MSTAGVTTRVGAVLFDLDGTLIDSAPDLAGACNDMRLDRGLPALPYTQLRSMVGSGARGMVGVGFGVAPDGESYQALREEFLRRYEARMTSETQIFAAVPELLAALTARELPWGIVTNKAERFALPLTEWLGLARSAGAIVCGDTTGHAKPHPAPLLEAARRIGVEPAQCVYVGDDLRDVEAGRAAGMATLVAAWGYLGASGPVALWGADGIVDEPGGVTAWLDGALNARSLA